MEIFGAVISILLPIFLTTPIVFIIGILILSFKPLWLTQKLVYRVVWISTIYGAIGLGITVVGFLPILMSLSGGGINHFWAIVSILTLILCPLITLFALITLWTHYRLGNYKRTAQFAALAFFGPTILILSTILASLGPKASIHYLTYQKKIAELDQTIVTKVTCTNGYTWQVARSARISNGSGGPYISLRQTPELLDPQGQLIKSDTSISPSLVHGYQQAYITLQLATFMAKGLTSIGSEGEYRISPRAVEEADFHILAECLGKNLEALNEAITTVPQIANIRIQSEQLLSITRLYFLDPQPSNSPFVCTDGSKIWGNEFLSFVDPSDKDDTQPSGALVGPTGELIPAISRDSRYRLLDLKPDNTYLDLKRRVLKDTCVNKEGHNLRDVIMSLPERLHIFPTDVSEKVVMPNSPILTEYDKAIIENMKRADRVLQEHQRKYGTYRGFSLTSTDIATEINPDICDGSLTVDISPSGDTFVLHQPHCIDSRWSFCAEESSTKYITTLTNTVKTTYHCQ